jgi:hypothetical protein
MTSFFGAREGGADHDFVIASLTALFKRQGVIPPSDSFAKGLPILARPVGLIFGRPACKIFKEELLPDRRYYDLRSGANIELFYMGYADPDDEYLTIDAFDENDFSDASFVSAVSDFEKRTTWKYSGQTDLLLLNSYFTHHQKVGLDFTNALVIQLEEAVGSKLIQSGRGLLELIMRESQHSDAQDAVGKVSDVVFLRNAQKSLVSWALGLVKLKEEDLGNAYRSCVSDISRRVIT